MGPGSADIRDGGRLPPLLRRPAHPDLWEDCIREGGYCIRSKPKSPFFKNGLWFHSHNLKQMSKQFNYSNSACKPQIWQFITHARHFKLLVMWPHTVFPVLLIRAVELSKAAECWSLAVRAKQSLTLDRCIQSSVFATFTRNPVCIDRASHDITIWFESISIVCDVVASSIHLIQYATGVRDKSCEQLI